jgi:hypothetical protein
MSKNADRLRLVCEQTPRWGPTSEEKVMNEQIELVSLRQKVEGAFEGLLCLASAAVVLVGTLAICFPAAQLAGA